MCKISWQREKQILSGELNINFASKESEPLYFTTSFVNEDLNVLVIHEQQSNGAYIIIKLGTTL